MFSPGIIFFVKVIIARLMGVQSTALGFHRHTRRRHPVLEFQGWWGHTPVLVVLEYTFATSHVHPQQMSYVKICHDLHVQFLHGMIWNSGDESMPRSFFTIICFHCPDPFLCIEFVQWLGVFVNISKPPTIKTICDPSMLPLIKPICPNSISIIDPLIPINHHFPVLPIHSHCFAHRKYTDHNLPIISPWKKYLNIQHIRISQCSHPHSSPFIFGFLFSQWPKNQRFYGKYNLPSGYLTVRHGISMAHRNRWFTELKNGELTHWGSPPTKIPIKATFHRSWVNHIDEMNISSNDNFNIILIDTERSLKILIESCRYFKILYILIYIYIYT